MNDSRRSRVLRSPCFRASLKNELGVRFLSETYPRWIYDLTMLWVENMLTVSQLSKMTNTTPDAIRHYVRIGLLNPKHRQDNGYKLFSDVEVKKTLFIRRAKGLGFTLSDIQTIFDHSDDGRSPCPAVRNLIHKRIDENRRRLAELNELQRCMDDALEKWKSMPDGEPDGEAICHLIESIG